MGRKALRICVEVEIHAVSCPGVWLCPNGKVQLLLSMFGHEVQTKRLPPAFPLLFHEKFSFQKTYSSAGCLAEVQAALDQEDVFAVLVQETEDLSGGAVLARFHRSALDLLYPSPCSKGLLAGVDIDLLMEASADHPGILSPKIELSTRTTVEELTNYRPDPTEKNDFYVINPKTLCSQKRVTVGPCNPGRQVKEIHSDGRYSRPVGCLSQGLKQLQSDMEPPVGLPSGSQHRSTTSSHCLYTSRACLNTSPTHERHHKNVYNDRNRGTRLKEPCQCGVGHLASKCHLCTRYKAIFSSMTNIPGTEILDESTNLGTGSITYKHRAATGSFQNLDNISRLSSALHARVDRVLKSTCSNTYCDGVQCQKFKGEHKYTSPIPEAYINPRSLHYSNHNIAGFTSHHPQPHSDQSYEQRSGAPSDMQPPGSLASCGSGDEGGSYRQLFYTNLEKFYRKLYLRAKNRAQREGHRAVPGI